MRERDWQGHEFRRVVAGKAKHQALIAGTLIFFVVAIHALVDVGRLSVDRCQNRTGLVVETHLGRRVADILDRGAHDFWIGKGRVGRDLTSDDGHSRLDHHLAGNASFRILFNDRVNHGVRDLIAHFVRVSLGHGF